MGRALAGLRLTSDVLRAAYAYLEETEPFRSWNLPDAEDVRFVVSRGKGVQGWAVLHKKEIAISSACVGCTRVLMEIMAHEMVHMHVDRHGDASPHGPHFLKAAKKVCAIHGFDYKSFI